MLPMGTPGAKEDYDLATNRITQTGADHDDAGNMTAIPFGSSAIAFQGSGFADYGFHYDADGRRRTRTAR
jgi:hypothetical protein